MLTIGTLALLAGAAAHSRQQRYAGQSGEAQSMKHSNSATARLTDKEFARKAAEGGLAQVKVGQLAEEKGQSQTVKDFGKRMVDDHSKAARRTEAGSSKLEYHAAGSARCQRSGDL
jgi:putative membrane protein